MIFCAIRLLDISGFELVAPLPALLSHPSTTIIALSGLLQPTNRERARQAGFDAMYVKPMDPQVLKTLLERLIDPATLFDTLRSPRCDNATESLKTVKSPYAFSASLTDH